MPGEAPVTQVTRLEEQAVWAGVLGLLLGSHEEKAQLGNHGAHPKGTPLSKSC